MGPGIVHWFCCGSVGGGELAHPRITGGEVAAVFPEGRLRARIAAARILFEKIALFAGGFALGAE